MILEVAADLKKNSRQVLRLSLARFLSRDPLPRKKSTHFLSHRWQSRNISILMWAPCISYDTWLTRISYRQIAGVSARCDAWVSKIIAIAVRPHCSLHQLMILVWPMCPGANLETLEVTMNHLPMVVVVAVVVVVVVVARSRKENNLTFGARRQMKAKETELRQLSICIGAQDRLCERSHLRRFKNMQNNMMWSVNVPLGSTNLDTPLVDFNFPLSW